jgi:hypothetical protein
LDPDTLEPLWRWREVQGEAEMKQSLWWCVAVAALGLVACGEEASAPVAPAPEGSEEEEVYTGPTWFADVAPILEARCNTCHVEGGVGPYPLKTYDEAFATRAAIKASINERTMPPWQAVAGCMEYSNDISMTAAEIQTVTAWVDAGAPMGDPAAAPQAAPKELLPPLSRVDRTLALPEPYTPILSPDDYRCFIVDWPDTEPRFVTGFHVRPGNPRTAHHVIAFLASPDRVAEFEDLDDAEPGPGYTCFGGPGGESDIDTRWVGAWAPGAESGDFPAGTGIRIAPGSKIILQMHYNTLNGDGADLTELDFKLDDQVEREAVLMPFANPAWVLGGAMPIRKDDPAATHTYVADFTEFIPFLSDGRLSGERFRIYSAALHMHGIGERGSLTHLRGGSQEDQGCMLQIEGWDFNWQRTYRFKEPVVFQKGDGLQLSCTWDNSPENQPMAMVDTDGDGVGDTYQQLPSQRRNWGEGTTDEMCLGVLYVTQE